jgi:hypothetical protein
MIGAGRMREHLSGPLCLRCAGWLFSFQADCSWRISSRWAVMVAFHCGPLSMKPGVGNERLQRRDTLGFYGGRQRGDARGLLGLNPCLPECPCEALAADVGELDLRIAVGLAEDRPGAGHEGCVVDFGRSFPMRAMHAVSLGHWNQPLHGLG